MRQYDIKGRNALVTGASSGMGKELAYLLAREGANLVLAALPAEEDALEALARELEERHGIMAFPVAVDLADPGGPEFLHRRTMQQVPHLDILVNCAGLYAYGDFHELPLERQLLMIQVNVKALTALTHLFLPGMIARREGRVLNFSSTAAFQPTANEAVYAATKAYVQSFSEAVRQEVRHHGVKVCTINPPATRTPMTRDLPPDLPWFKIVPLADPVDMAAAALKALKRGKAFHVPDGRNYFLHVLLPRISSRESSARSAYVMMRPRMKKMETGVIALRAETEIDTDPQSVFNLMIDTRRHPDFVFGYVRQDEGPEILSPGVVFHWRIRLYGTTFRAHSRVSQFDSPRRYQEQIHIPGLMRATLTKSVCEVEGRTRLDWVWEYTPAFGLVGRLIDKVIGGERTTQRGIEESVMGIKRILESGKV